MGTHGRRGQDKLSGSRVMGDGSPWPETALILAAGLGTRMRPLTLTVPKALVQLGGQALIDRAIDRLARAGVGRIVINLHHRAKQLTDHLGRRRSPTILFSSEEEGLLETGGAVKRAASLLQEEPVWIVSVDSVWMEKEDAFRTLAAEWRKDAMDCLLMLADTSKCSGIDGFGDFDRCADGQLRFRTGARADFAYAGLSLLAPSAAEADDRQAFPLRDVWRRLAAQGRLFGAELQGEFLHVGDPEALRVAEGRLSAAKHPACPASGRDDR